MSNINIELEDLDKLIIAMGMLEDKCKGWRQDLERMKDGGGANRYDVEKIVFMAQLLKIETRLMEQTISTATQNLIKNNKTD